MNTLDTLFVTYIVGIVTYSQITPGTQMIPPFWKVEERMNWKPSKFFWINMCIIFGYILFRKQIRL